MADGERYLLFVSTPSGYELTEREGDAPTPGAEVDLDDARYVVSKIASSPLPGDERRCAYLQPLRR